MTLLPWPGPRYHWFYFHTREIYVVPADIAESLETKLAQAQQEIHEDQGVIRVWRGRTRRAELERDRLLQEVDILKNAMANILREHSNDDQRPRAFYIASKALSDVEDRQTLALCLIDINN
jgi:hypothetical protein